MDDDWGDDVTPVANSAFSTPAISEGKTFGGRGRGFIPASNGFGGGGGRRGGRGGGNGGGFHKSDGENGFERGGGRNNREGGERKFRPRDDGGENGFERGGGRDNREGGERKFRSRDDGDNKKDGEEKKPPVSYIPPEPTDNEDELYSSGISSGINFSKYDDIPVKVSGENAPPGIRSFKESGLRPFLLEIIEKCRYTKPTPVQKHAIPIVMNGRDIMACAQTGSGKTASYLLPIINRLLESKEDALTDGECVQPHAIILSPTRELASQIHNEARKFTKHSSIRTCLIYGGVQVGHQIRQLLEGAHILTATPGRLIDFLERGKINFSSIKYVVLDEADRMLDMGFKPAIDKMMNHTTMVPKTERQTLMFSATFPDEIQRMAIQYLNEYLFVAVGMVGGACTDVEQRILEVPREGKMGKLIELLKDEGSKRTVVFVETKRQADIVSVILSEKKFPATSMHGDREQRQREEALSDFKYGRMDILVATAVAARGLDIEGVTHVINYDLPKSIDDYVHKIGRTGRLGNRGLATSFYDPDKDSEISSALIKILSEAQQEVPDFLQGNVYSSRSDDNGFGGQDFRKNVPTNESCVADDW